MSHDRLVVMANQIGQFFASSQGPERGVDGVADHLRKFWEPRMRLAAYALLRQGGEGLDPVPRQALERLAAEHALLHTDHAALQTAATSPDVGDATEA